jgi:predicted ATP-dependent endonuclease of OLD family
MILKSIKISNYRSIEDIEFDIEKLNDNSYTYGLIGINEAGKSSILKALALKDTIDPSFLLPKDFRDKSKPIEIDYFYYLDEDEIEDYINKISIIDEALVQEIQQLDLKNIEIRFVFNSADISQKQMDINIKTKGLPDGEIKKEEVLEVFLRQEIILNTHNVIFWTSEDKYLISQPISLADFNADPNISIPLKNSFALAGIQNIQDRLAQISDPTDTEQLEEELGKAVTKHINRVWPQHPIKITFKIGDGFFNFHIKDKGAKGKAKTADQRSDGFKQFVSFLLTISAESINEQLINTILLLDEPETHLHPQAQEELLKELINITNSNKGNIVFFATHSNHMIDKDRLNRNYKIIKEKDETKKEQFNKSNATYASVIYEVFEIPNTDYHNELYGYIQAQAIDADENNYYEEEFEKYLINNSIEQDQKYIRLTKDGSTKEQQRTLPTKIRNAIHHPENKHNSFTSEELKKSINMLKDTRDIIIIKSIF